MATANQDEVWSVGSNAAYVGGVMTFRIFRRNQNTGIEVTILITTDSQVYTNAMVSMAPANQDGVWSVGSNAAYVGGVMTFRIFSRNQKTGIEVTILITTDSQVYKATMEHLTNEEYTESWYEYIYDLLNSAM